MKEDEALKLETAFVAVSRAEEDELLIYAQGSARLQFEYLRDLHPALVEYRGGLFIENSFDQSVVDDILVHSDEAEPIVAAQKHVNSLLLGDAEADEPFDPALARAIGEGVAYCWSNWIRDRFGREVVTVIDIAEYQGSVWFRAV